MWCPIRTASQKLKLGLCFVLVSHVVASGDSKRGGGGGGSHCFPYSAVNCHCMAAAAAAAGRSDGWLYTSYLCLELLVRAAFAIVVGVRASTVNNKFYSTRLATSRSELLHSAVVLSSICAQKTSGALPAIHPSRGSCQNLPCTTKVSRIPRGRVVHVLVDTQRESVCEWQYALNRSRVACDHQENLPESAQPLFSHVHVPPTCLRTPKNTQGHGQVCSCMQLLSSATAVRVS